MFCPTAAAAEPPRVAIITQDKTALRAGPRDSARAHTLLWQGEIVEVRGERMDYLQVYDYRRERGGFVRASQARRLSVKPGDAPDLLAVVRFLRETTGAEALGIGFAAAYIQAAPAEVLAGDAGIEALDALGTFADRLARRASAGAPHLEVAAHHGVRFFDHERNGRIVLCYDGDAFRRVLAMRSTPEQRARAALALTRTECTTDAEWRAGVLDRVDAAALPAYLRNRVLMRRAAAWSSLAYARSRKGGAADAARRALAELAGVVRSELTDDDRRAYSEAALRTSASRVAAATSITEKRMRVATEAGKPGETCVLLMDAKQTLARRCTYGVVWPGSATVNPEGTALALAVQTLESWRELWLFHKAANGRWTVRVLTPAGITPEVGYAEFAGWVPGGAQMLVAREALGEGKLRRSFELVRLDTLVPVRQASDPAGIPAFRRWQDAAWRRETLSLR